MTDFIDFDDEKYSENLRKIKNPPKRLYYKGDINLLNTPCFSVVGSRELTDYGQHVEKRFVNHIALRGITIVSGLAVGADGVAHKEALDLGEKTIAVIGGGFNHIFPPENIKLYERIVNEGGLVISEYKDDVEASSQNFPIRNRIIAGLSLGVLVVEAKARSGSGITARYAKEQGKKVFAFPRKAW